jgi:acetoin utilization protein AcuB
MDTLIPTVEEFMTPTPISIPHDQPLSLALHTMREHRIRHLPVLQGEALVGVLSERDVALASSLRELDVATLRAEEAMTPVVYTVAPDARLDRVAADMAEHRYGSAFVVTEGNRVVGIFTTVDACRALAELLHTRLVA